MKILNLVIIIIVFAQCTSKDDGSIQPDDRIMEAVSLFGNPLYRPDFDHETLIDLTEQLREAVRNFNEYPDEPESIIWVGRRAANLWRYQDAIFIYSDGLSDYPDDPKFYRHRGHRYITVREFDYAIKDLSYASELIRNTEDEIEPDGMPNKFNIPVSTLQFNIWYHLGLAHYLKGDFVNAIWAYEECLKVSVNNDMIVSTTDWLYMSYRRLGDKYSADRVLEIITPEMEILESHSYLNRLLMYKGLFDEKELMNTENLNYLELVTQGYGVANWNYYNGNISRAEEIMNDILKTGYWSAFGYIAAEADLSRGLEIRM